MAVEEVPAALADHACPAVGIAGADQQHAVWFEQARAFGDEGVRVGHMLDHFVERDGIEAAVFVCHVGEEAAVQVQPALLAVDDGQLRGVDPFGLESEGLRRRDDGAVGAADVEQPHARTGPADEFGDELEIALAAALEARVVARRGPGAFVAVPLLVGFVQVPGVAGGHELPACVAAVQLTPRHHQPGRHKRLGALVGALLDQRGHAPSLWSLSSARHSSLQKTKDRPGERRVQNSRLSIRRVVPSRAAPSTTRGPGASAAEGGCRSARRRTVR